MPGQFPMVALERVRALNSVDLPALGAPTSAMTGVPGGLGAKDCVEWQDGPAIDMDGFCFTANSFLCCSTLYCSGLYCSTLLGLDGELGEHGGI